MSLSVLKPAPVSLPSYVKNVGVINRSLPVGKIRVLDALDKIVSMEGANMDKAGSAAGISGLTNELNRNTRFTEVKILDLPELGNNIPSAYPAPLSWDVVETICRDNKTDALFSLELFDTDSKISYAAYPVKLNTPLGNVPVIEQEATLQTMVKAGWRIYDPKGRYILDEFAIARELRYSGRGINPVMAANALIGRKEAVKEVGSRAGQGYAYRVLPYWLRVSRNYYVRGNSGFKMARRKAETGNWDEAGKIWKEETINDKRKLAGRACYNMAIISEINGDLDGAIQWAQKAYEDYNNKLALNYIRILKNRKINDEILKEQQSQEIAGNNSGSEE
jgi:hypothetical protein